MQPAQRNAAAGSNEARLVYGPLTLDPQGWTATVNNHVVPLTLSEFVVLNELAHNAYRVFSRDALAHVLAGSRAPASRGSAISGRAVDLLVSRVRRKLLAAGYDGIRTMRYVGYRFVPPGDAAGGFA